MSQPRAIEPRPRARRPDPATGKRLDEIARLFGHLPLAYLDPIKAEQPFTTEFGNLAIRSGETTYLAADDSVMMISPRLDGTRIVTYSRGRLENAMALPFRVVIE